MDGGCFCFCLLYSFSTMSLSILLTTCHVALRLATYASYHLFLPTCLPAYLPVLSTYRTSYLRILPVLPTLPILPSKKCPSMAASKENEGKKGNGFGKLFFSLFPQTRTQHSPLIFLFIFLFFFAVPFNTHTLSVFEQSWPTASFS